MHGNFCDVVFMVGFYEALQDFTAGLFANGEADALLGCVEAETH
jgi:hypothetical protein